MEQVGAAFHPDGGIACPPNYIKESAGALDNPNVLFEVLSPSIASYDQNQKFDAYARLASLQDYVLIATDMPRVEIRSRQDGGSWAMRVYPEGTTAHIPSVELDISLAELYERAAFEPAAALPHSRA